MCMLFLPRRVGNAIDYETALRRCDVSERIYPRYYQTYVERGQTLHAQGVWVLNQDAKREKATGAIEAFDRALQLNEYDLLARYGKSQSYMLLGDYDRAVGELTAILRKAPTHYFYLRELGLALRYQGRYEQALKVFKKARKTRGRDEVVVENIRFLNRKLRQQKREKRAADQKAKQVEAKRKKNAHQAIGAKHLSKDGEVR